MRLEAYRSFLEQLTTLLRSGIPILESLAQIERASRTPAAHAAERLRARIEKGATLGEAMAAEPDSFPPAHAALLGAAEKTGAVPQVLARLQEEIERRLAMRRALLAKSAYPILVLVLVPLLVPLYLIFQGRLGAYLGLQLLALGGLGAAAAAAFGLRKRLAAWAARAPFVGSTVRRAALGESLSLLGLLVEGGMGIREALATAARAARSAEVARGLDEAALWIGGGKNLTESLAALEGIPDAERGRIAAGEHAGAMDRALRSVGRDLEERAQRAIARAFSVLPVVLYLAVAAVVGVIYIRTMLGSFPKIGGV